MTSGLVGDLFECRRKTAALVGRLLTEHVGKHFIGLDQGRGHQQHLRTLFLTSEGGGLGGAHEPCRAVGYVLRGLAEIGLGIIGAEHDDDQIEGRVRLHARPQVSQTCQTVLDGIIPDSRPAVMPFFDHGILFTEKFLQDARPPHVFLKTASVFSVVSPGVGITETKDPLFHSCTLLSGIYGQAF